MDKIITSRYLNNISDIRKTIIANTKHKVELKDSSIFDFNLDHLFNTIIIDYFREKINSDDLDMTDNLLNIIGDPINEYFYTENDKYLDIKTSALIKFNLISAYLENKDWINEGIKEYRDSMINEDGEYMDSDYNEYIVYNVCTKEIAITDSDNINYYGAPNELIIYQL